jgi:hypothetical protein
VAYNKTNTIESHRDTIEINHTAKAAQPELHILTVAGRTVFEFQLPPAMDQGD